TVMGSGNRLISADWPGPTGEKVEVALGGTAVVMPAANGRTQPERPSGSDPEKLDAYSSTIASLALESAADAVQVVGDEVAAEKTALTGNDNFLFNIAPTIGDHVMCTAIGLALDVGFPGDPLRDPRCATWLGEPDVNPTTQLPN